MTQPMIEELRAVLGPLGCLTGAGMAASAQLWDLNETSAQEMPLALLRPASVEEVSAALAICHRHGQAVVPQGGMTGLAGGANPRAGDVALSMARFAGVEEVDPASATMTVKAGTVLEVAQRAAEAEGLLLPIDLGARGSCQIGGAIATNAGGIRVLMRGSTRDNLLGIEAVMADGTVISHLSKYKKDNTGYNLTHLLAGSEGTLAVITRAVIRLHPLPAMTDTALCAVENFGQVIALFTRFRRDLRLSAFEVMWADYFRWCGGEGLFSQVPPLVLLVEAEGPGLEGALEQAIMDELVYDALIPKSLAEVRKFWEVRESSNVAWPVTNAVNLDVSLPLEAMEGFATTCMTRMKALGEGVAPYVFGHVGDGNLHLVVGLPEADPKLIHAVDQIAYDQVRAVNGSVSAEHGVGTEKRDWLGYSRSPEEIAVMRAIKAALDPKGILNPGKVI